MTTLLMFIDDDIVFHEVLRRACRKISNLAPPIFMSDGGMALDFIVESLAASTPLPDAAFVDVNMPGKDGFDFLKEFAELRTNHEKLSTIHPIVMLTSSCNDRDRERAAELGADDYVVKGMTMAEIQAAIVSSLA